MSAAPQVARAELAPVQPGRRAFALLLVASFLHGLAFLLLLPPWMGEDEPWHVEYAHHVASGHRPWGGIEMAGAAPGRLDDRTLMSLSQLQVRRRIHGLNAEEIARTQQEILDSMRAHHFWARVAFAGWGPGTITFDQFAGAFTATHQPPTYYLLTGGLLRALGIRDVEAQMWALRAVSLVCYLATVACAYALGRCVSSDGWIALGCALFVAWLPTHARQAAVANNDVLAKVFAALAIVCGARILAGRGGARAAVLLLACAGLGLVTKASAAGALAVAGPALAWLLRKRFGRLGGTGVGLAAAGALALGAAAYWYNSHNPALPRQLSNLRHRLAAAMSGELWESFGRTFAGAFCWETRGLPAAATIAVGAGMALALAGAICALARRRTDVERRVLLACAAAVLLALAFVGLRGEGKARYLFPVLPALGALVACGLLAPLPPRRRPAALGLFACALVAYDALFLWRGLLWSEYGRWGS